MLTFINLILENLELPLVLDISFLQSALLAAVEWWQVLNPQILFSIIFYFSCSWGLFSLTLRLMYRVLKKIIKYPHSKGCEFK